MDEQSGVGEQDISVSPVLNLPDRQSLIIDGALNAGDFARCSIQLDALISRLIKRSVPVGFKTEKSVTYDTYSKWLDNFVYTPATGKRQEGIANFTQGLGFELAPEVFDLLRRVQAGIDTRVPTERFTPSVVEELLSEIEPEWQAADSSLFYVSAYVVFQAISDSIPRHSGISRVDKDRYTLLGSCIDKLHIAASHFSSNLIQRQDPEKRMQAFASDAAADAFNLETQRRRIGNKPLRGRYSPLEPMDKKRRRG